MKRSRLRHVMAKYGNVGDGDDGVKRTQTQSAGIILVCVSPLSKMKAMKGRPEACYMQPQRVCDGEKPVVTLINDTATQAKSRLSDVDAPHSEPGRPERFY
jgi:hypothetical protein